MNKIIREITKKITLAIDEYDMIKPSQSVVVGFSGGADSAMLCHFLHNFLKADVIACHINHNLRGEESIRDREFVREFCNTNGIECYIYDVDIAQHAKDNKLSIELAGREIRYRYFSDLALKYNCKIATAHTLSDSVETLIFNLARGSGLEGICGIQPVRNNILRPLIYCKREDIENYCKEYNVPYVTDSTNLTTDYTRNRIRHNIVPELEQINSAAQDHILNTIQMSTQAVDFIKETANNVYEKVLIKDIVHGDVIDLKKLKELNCHVAVSAQLIKKFLENQEISITFELINFIEGMILSCCGKINVGKDKFIEIVEQGQKLVVVNAVKDVEYFEDPCVEDTDYLSKTGKNYKIYSIFKNNFEKVINVNKILFILQIDYDTIKGELVFRQRKACDTITLAHRNCTKTIKKLFNEEKVPIRERESRFIVACGQKLVGVEGIGVSQEYAVTDKTKKILCIEQIDDLSSNKD